jgi:hypothetical protein
MSRKFYSIVGSLLMLVYLIGFGDKSLSNDLVFPATDTARKVIWKIIDKQEVKKYLPDSLESRYYVVHFSAKSFSIDSLKLCLPYYDAACDSIIRILVLHKPDKKVVMYIYPDEDIKYELMGWPGKGSQTFSNGEMHVLNLDDMVHESTHFLFNSEISWFTMPFLSEGIAMYVESIFFPDSLQRHKSAMKQYLNEPLEQWINGAVQFWAAPLYNNWRPATYVASGLFVKYLIENYGLDKCKELYKKIRMEMKPAEFNAVFQDVIGKSIPEITTEWKETIKSY